MEQIALVVSPHQDDAEIGMGGTICALQGQGMRIVVLDLSDGEPTPRGSVEIRAVETKRASSILGLQDRLLLGLPNREIFDTVANRKRIAEVIREVQPTVVFSPYWEDAHPDHVNASALVDAARFYSKFVKTDLSHRPWYPRKQFYFFSTHLRVQIRPSFIFDISGYLDTKMAAIQAFDSQFGSDTSNAHRVQTIRNEALYWGSQIGVEAGEPFMCRESLRISSMQTLCSL